MPTEVTPIEDFVKITKVPAVRKKALMLRAGGLGDILILTPVAKALFNKGYDVDMFIGSPTGAIYKLIEALPYIHEVKEISRINNIDCIRENDSFISVELIKPKYDEVFDFKFSIEDNRAGLNKVEGWRSSLNSNYMNWIDLSLAWANIDYTKISDEDKNPEIAYKRVEGESDPYKNWVSTLSIFGKSTRLFKVIGVQLQASSLIRSWYRANELPAMIHEKYPDDVVMIFSGKQWNLVSKYGSETLQFPDDLDPLICSALLISEMDVFISADSGTSHLGEVMETDTIGIYTTVPSWTRTKYYKYAYPIDAEVPCHPCFTLDVYCPLERKKADESINEREKDIINQAKVGANIVEVAKKYKTIPKAIDDELKAAMGKVQALSATMPACVAWITSEMILEKLEQVLGKYPTLKRFEPIGQGVENV